MRQKIKILYFFCTIVCVYLVYQYYIFVKSPLTLVNSLIIPDIVHYVLFNINEIDFITYLSLVSAMKVQKPSVIFLHNNNKNISGYYLELLELEAKKRSVRLIKSFLDQPTHVYGQKLSSVYHSSDIARIQVLMTYGGIYLDSDMVLINNVEALRTYDCVVGKPDNQYMGTQFIIANSKSRFLQLWLKGYKKYRPTSWYYNAGEYPTKLLEEDPTLARIEPELFGVQNLLNKLTSVHVWNDWKEYYGLHLLSRHHQMYGNLNEARIRFIDNNFGRIAQWILDK